MVKKKRKSEATQHRPQALRSLVRDIRKQKPLDRRTAISKQLGNLRDQLDGDLETTAKALLLADASAASLICQVALRLAMNDPKMVDEQGNHCTALGTFSKFSAIKRASLLALKRFEDPKKPSKSDEPELKDPENLGELIVDFEPEQSESEAM